MCVSSVDDDAEQICCNEQWVRDPTQAMSSGQLGIAQTQPQPHSLSLQTFDLTSSTRSEEHCVTHITNALNLRDLLIRKSDGQKAVKTFWWSENRAHEGSIGNQKTSARRTQVNMKFTIDAQEGRR
jgi:hypothetical protein